MRVVDTSAWIEWLIDGPVALQVRLHVPSLDQLLVPTIVQFELAKWLTRERPHETLAVVDRMRECVVVALDTDNALRSAETASRYRLSVADAIIYETALAYDADLLTCDRHFDGLPNIIYIPKAA